MADIELVIKIPEEEYNDFCERYVGSHNTVINAMCNAKPLPKGHGDLKDMEDIYEALEGWDDDTAWIVDTIDSQTPIIIEADKTTNLSRSVEIKEDIERE